MRRRSSFGLVAAFAAWSSPLVAQAQTSPDACLDESDRARALAAERRLVEARARLRACADPTCPDTVRSLCGERLAEIAARIPTVLFDVKDEDASDLTDVQLDIDGTHVETERWLGAELPLDPGSHAFTFTRPAGERVDIRLVLVETEKGRREHVVFRRSRPIAGPRFALVAAPEPRPSRVLPTAGWITAGAGAVALGIGIAFGVMALSKNADARCDDANVCEDPRSRNDARSAATVSTIGVLTGAAAIVGGLAMVLFAPSAARRDP